MVEHMVVVKSQNGIRKNILFKPAIDAVVRRYKDQFERKGIANSEERARWLVHDDFALGHVDRELRGRARAIALHPVVWARYVFEEAKLMRDPETARMAEAFTWKIVRDPRRTVTEADSVQARKNAIRNSGELRFYAKLAGYSAFASVGTGIIMAGCFWLFSVWVSPVYAPVTNIALIGTTLGIFGGVITVAVNMFQHYVNVNNRKEGEAYPVDVQTVR